MDAEKDRDKQRLDRKLRDQEKRKVAQLAESAKKDTTKKSTPQPVFEGWKATAVDDEWDSLETDSKPKPKVVKKVKKEKDANGWITEKVEVVVDGVLKSAALEEEKKEAPKKKKKNKTLSSEQIQQQQRQQQLVQKKKDEEVSAAYLETNPFSLIMQDNSYESISDSLHQKNMSKGKARNDENNRVINKTKKKGKGPKAQQKQTPKEQPAAPAPAKKQEQKKQKPKSLEVDSTRVKQLSRTSKQKPFNIWEHEMFQPIAVALSVVAVVAVSYTFVFA
jgi:lipopolysaccharide export LptBFGC system permease protein LptF